MPIDFPNNPTSGQTYSYGINRWIYNGVAWDKLDNHPGICGGNQISINYAEGLNGATFTVNVTEGSGSGLDADLLDGVSGERFIENLETGLLYGGLLSINSGNTATFDITAGLAVFTTLNATTTSAPAPTVSYTQWTAKTGVTLAGLTSSDISFVSINSSGQFLQSNTPFTNAQYETQVPIGALIHPSRTYISFAQSYPHVAYDQASQSDTFIRSFGPLKISGHDISGYDATLQLSRASGVAYALGRNYANDPNSPNIVSDTNANPADVIYRQYRGATAGTWNTVVNTAVDPHNYDDGSGTLAAIPGGRYSIQRVFYFPNSPTVLLVYYGRATYNSIDTAKSALLFEQFSESQDSAESAIFCGYLIVKSGITNFSATGDYSIIQGGLFRSTVNVGGGGVAVANLDDLNDVTITSVANNQALVYDSSTGQWVNKSFSSLPVVTSFNGLTGAVTGVESFNGSTGTIVGVNSVRGLTGAVGITNGSGIGLSVSGQTMTFSNTGVLSIDGSTGAITNVARTNVSNIFTADQLISAPFTKLSIANTVLGVTSEYGASNITHYSGTNIQTISFNPTNPTNTITLPNVSTTLAGLAAGQTFTNTNTFNNLTRFIGGISSAGGTFSGNQIFINGATFTGNISAPNIVNSIRGLTGIIGITNGSGIGLSVSGQTMTFSNTGVLSINGGTGSILNVAKINANNFFTTSQDISGSITVTDPGTFNNISLDPNTGKITFYEDSLGNITELYTGGYNNQAIMLPGSNTTLAGLAVDPQTFTGTNTFNTLTRFPGGISAAGATFSSHVRFLSGFSAGVGAGNCFMSFNPASSANNGGLWIQNGNLQLAGSAFGAGNGSLQYSINSEYLNLYGFAYINNSYNYQAARVPLRLNAAPTQSVPIFAAYKQTVEGTAITATYSATNMVAGIDNNGALFSSVGLSAAGGITFSSRINFTAGISGSGGVTFANNAQAATFTETSNNIRVTNNARSWFI